MKTETIFSRLAEEYRRLAAELDNEHQKAVERAWLHEVKKEVDAVWEAARRKNLTKYAGRGSQRN